jgi:hypothetical protein
LFSLSIPSESFLYIVHLFRRYSGKPSGRFQVVLERSSGSRTAVGIVLAKIQSVKVSKFFKVNPIGGTGPFVNSSSTGHPLVSNRSILLDLGFAISKGKKS